MLVKKIYETKLKKYQRQINNRLAAVVDGAEDPQTRELLKYAVQHGRRFRPLLFLLAYKVLGKELNEQAYQLATAVELLHKASLLHDDLIDGDRLRRGELTFHARFGAGKAVIVGDLLVAEAGVLFTRWAPSGLIPLWFTQYQKMCRGELLDVIGVEGPQDAARVDEIIYGKTASFLEFVMRAAATAAGGSNGQQQGLAEFGKHIGFMFQVINDWNNWTGFEEAVGRRTGQDLAQGKMNHIWLILSEEESAEPDRREEVLRSKIKAIVERHAAEASRALDGLGLRNKYTRLLQDMLKEKHAAWYWVDSDKC